MQLTNKILLAAAIATTAAVATPRIAAACGSYGPPPTEAELDQRRVRSAVYYHLSAVKRGDAKALHRMWTRTFRPVTVVQLSRNGKRVVAVTPIAKAIAKWTQGADKNMRWTTNSVRIKGRTATVHVSIDWHGAKLDERLRLTKIGGSWHLVGKRFRVVSEAPKAVTPAASLSAAGSVY